VQEMGSIETRKRCPIFGFHTRLIASGTAKLQRQPSLQQAPLVEWFS
jgi:hypothetical protein